MNLYELTNDLQNAMDALQIDEETGEVTGFEAVDSLDLAFEEKAEAYAVTIKNLLAFAKSVKEETDSMKQRAKLAENKANRLKEHLAQSMIAVGKTKISMPRAGLSFRLSRSVLVTDEALLEDDLFRVKMSREPDLTKIRELLTTGQKVPGCKMQEKQNLQIK